MSDSFIYDALRHMRALLAMGEDQTGVTPEQEVQGKVDAVIDVLAKGRVVPREVDRIDDAVQRARRDAGVGRAMGR